MKKMWNQKGAAKATLKIFIMMTQAAKHFSQARGKKNVTGPAKMDQVGTNYI